MLNGIHSELATSMIVMELFHCIEILFHLLLLILIRDSVHIRLQQIFFGLGLGDGIGSVVISREGVLDF